jgi:hypothetical protein
MRAAWKIVLVEKYYFLQALDVVSLSCSAKALKEIFITIHSNTINGRQIVNKRLNIFNLNNKIKHIERAEYNTLKN